MKEMTSLERIRAVLEGRLPDQLPVLPQQVEGRNRNGKRYQ